MPSYTIRAKSLHDGKTQTLVVPSKSRVLRFLALFNSNLSEWGPPQVEVEGKIYLGPDWRRDLP